MNNFKTTLCIFAAMALAAFALPSVAGNDKKQYDLQMQITSATSPFTVQATITNKGNSTINSFVLTVSGVTIVGVAQPATGKAAITGQGYSVSVTNMHPLKSGDSVAVTMTLNSCGDGMWSASVWTGSSLNGQSFGLVAGDPGRLETLIACGSLGGNQLEFSVPNTISPPGCGTGVLVQRGYYDKNGDANGASLPFFVTNLAPQTNDLLHFRWSQTTDSAATFQYTICAPGPVLVPTDTQVAWFNQDGTPASTPGNPDLIPALRCDSHPEVSYVADPDILPTPYATLVSDTGGTTITVDNTTLDGFVPSPATPFAIVIGTERMVVRACVVPGDEDDGAGSDASECGEQDEGTQTWTVDRCQGGTCTTPSGHAAHALVMSTPLPIMTTTPAQVSGKYLLNNQAQMCIMSQTCNDEACGTHTTILYDIGDGWGSHP